MTNYPPPLVLLTDFGLEGPYVGQMKGILAELAPGHPVIDLTHSVSPQDVREGAFLLEVSWRHFPAGSVFIAVVDPGVGTERALLAIEAEGRTFVGPDNGLLTGALPSGTSFQAVRLENERYRLPTVSATFHGRDVFVPAGAALASGVPLDELGPPVHQLEQLSDRFPVVSPTEIRGRVIHADRFGNLVTDIAYETWAEWAQGRTSSEVNFQIGGEMVKGLKTTYGEAAWGEMISLFGSLGYLEIAVNGGSAAERLGLRRGEIVVR
jgi:hypothetical protein